MTEQFAKGDVVRYPYMWRWQDELEREHGEKDRPVCIILPMRDDNGLTHMLLLPISSKPPREDQTALEIPALELRRVKLTGYARGWITVSECNYDIAEKSFHFDPRQKPLGRFGNVFLEEVRNAFVPFLAARTAKIDRTK